MSADLLVARWTRPARRRSVVDDLAIGAPVAALLAAAAWRVGGIAAAIAALVLGLAILASLAAWRTRRFDRSWIVRRLDADRAEMEDSAGLLFASDDDIGPLQRLQRARLQGRLGGEAEAGRLSPAWSRRRIAAAWLAGFLLTGVVLAWPGGPLTRAALAPAHEAGVVPQGAPKLTALRLRVTPPAYSGLAPFDAPGLDAKAPAGSRLQWTLRFSPQAAAVGLAFPDGAALALAPAGADWSGGAVLDRSRLYRVAARGGPAAPPAPLHRLEAIGDAPPTIRVIAPARTLTPIAPGQRVWPLAFQVEDDYAVADIAQLHLTFAEGEGENVAFHERVVTVRGEGGPHAKRFSANLDLAALGFKAGGDLIAQLVASDTRTPEPQVVRSPSLILRWATQDQAQGTGLDAAVKQVLPAYLRSQRQVIIDIEALLKERRKLDAAHFASRSQSIAEDQHGLRLRYSQFLGGEDEKANEHALPTNDESAGPATAKSNFGAAEDVLGEYGHVHDQPEAATLLDPKTRATLTQALDQMWRSETNLRQSDPAAALPFAYKALGFIKEVQQATRVFLARVGSELPPIDETRRLTGDRAGLERHDLALAPVEATDAAPVAAWRALQDAPQGATPSQLDALGRWLRDDPARAPDRLSLEAALDAVRSTPGCRPCRRKLGDLLWGVLARPPPGVARRGAGGEAGRRYLDALSHGPLQ